MESNRDQFEQELKENIEAQLHLYNQLLLGEYCNSRPTFEVRITRKEESINLQIGIVYKYTYKPDNSFKMFIGRTETWSEVILERPDLIRARHVYLYKKILRALGEFLLFDEYSKKTLFDYLKIKEDKLRNK